MTKFSFLLATAITIAGVLSFAHAQYNYAEVIEKSLLFYEAQRTGKLPANNRISWRRDSFLNDMGENGDDLSGGYFDAGDYVKFGFPLASAMTMLAWGLADNKEGFQKAGQWEYAKDALKWGMDYMIKSHPEPNVLYVQVGDGNSDHSWWGRPEDWPDKNPRPTMKANTSLPASEVAAEQAAAMAAAAGVYLNDGDTAYGTTLLTHAQQLYTFATTYRGKYSDSFPDAAQFYNSYSGYGDEFFWAAAWLYRVTQEPRYQQDYERWWTEFNLNRRPAEASWDDKAAQAQTLLANIDGSQKYVDASKNFCDWAVDQATKTPKGLIFISQWGSLRHAGNVAFVCLQAAEAGINPEKYRNFAKQQIGYMLGDTGRSFVVGYGNNPPQRPHHKSSSCRNPPATCDWNDYNSQDPNPQVLNGALVGGPDQNDKYDDKRDDYVSNEVAIDYNAGFQSALAGLCKLYCGSTDTSNSNTTNPLVGADNSTISNSTSLDNSAPSVGADNSTSNSTGSENNSTTSADSDNSSTSNGSNTSSTGSNPSSGSASSTVSNDVSSAPTTNAPTSPSSNQQRRPNSPLANFLNFLARLRQQLRG